MSVLDTAPLTLVLDDNFFYFIVWSCAAALDQNTRVELVGQNTDHRFRTPFAPATGLKGGFVFDPNGAFIL